MKNHRRMSPSIGSILCVMSLSGLILSVPAAAARQPQASPSIRRLAVDPLMLAQAAEVWSVIAQPANPVWPGWNAASTPILIYLPGKQDVLINHPSPPTGFEIFNPPFRTPFRTIHIRNGATLQEFDGQNTSMDVNGVQTLVVADTLSTRRQNLESLLGFAATATTEQLKESIEGNLLPNPYDSMALFAHEAFHVFQDTSAPDKGANEGLLTQYPSLSAENNAAIAMEAEYLKEALQAEDVDRCRNAARRWLAIRRDRRTHLDASSIAYEDGTEFGEGLAKYVEYRLFQALQERTPDPAMAWLQGFNGYEDMSAPRQRLVDAMVGMLQGRSIVNNDPYGASPVRMRLYFSGMAVGALLDRIGPGWHSRIFQPDVTLTQLATEAISLSAVDQSRILPEIKSDSRYRGWLEEKKRLAVAGEEHVRKVVDEIEHAPRLILDYSALAAAKPGLGFTPFGILRVDADRTVFRLIPISGRIGDTRFSQTELHPVLRDRAKRQIIIPLSAAVTQGALSDAKEGASIELKDLRLPGLNLTGGRALVSRTDTAILLRLQP